MQRILIDHADITRTELDFAPDRALQPGEARLKLDLCALTANNVTYAATGFAIGYWRFFPSGVESRGLLPVWGFADVTETATEALAKGGRLFGFFPLAESVVMVPRPEGGGVVIDAAPHRADMPAIYNRYARCHAQSFESEALQALLQPLLATSYLLCDWLEGNGFFESEQVVVGSSSSKTGLGLCTFLAELDPRPVRIVGLTSDRNLEFVRRFGACDAVLTYDSIESLDKVPSVFVDMAGNAAVKQRVHAHLGDLLRHSSAVGISHWDRFRKNLDLAGPKPEFFFAPAQIDKRRAEWGPGVIERRIAAAWRRIADDAASWLDLKPHDGLAGAADVYDQLARGRADPREGHVIRM